MSFWELNDNSQKLETTGSFESGGGDMEPIPAKTQVKAAMDEVKLDDYQGESYISARWTILAPEQFKGRKIFQKIKVFDADPKKQDKAKRMLAAIAVNAGGGLLNEADPTSEMALHKHLMNKPMAILLQVWKIKDEQTGELKQGNWVSAVSPLNQQAAQQPQAQPEPADDDLGF